MLNLNNSKKYGKAFPPLRPSSGSTFKSKQIQLFCIFVLSDFSAWHNRYNDGVLPFKSMMGCVFSDSAVGCLNLTELICDLILMEHSISSVRAIKSHSHLLIGISCFIQASQSQAHSLAVWLSLATSEVESESYKCVKCFTM